MTVVLTDEQRRQIDAQPEAPVQMVDPTTNAIYVLVRLDEYDRLKPLLGLSEFAVREAYPLIDAVAGREGWDDAALDVYSDLRPAKTQ